MSYPVSKANSIQFKAGEETLAFAVVLDDFVGVYQWGLYKLNPSGAWTVPIFGDTNGIIEASLTSDKIMSFGSVANFLQAQFPIMQDKLKAYLGAIIPKPGQANKPECVGYDLHYDVVFNPADLSFSFNKEPPLSHAR
jgi:hypothetical protein